MVGDRSKDYECPSNVSHDGDCHWNGDHNGHFDHSIGIVTIFWIVAVPGW